MATISPLEWLGIAMATRAKEAGERVPKQEEYERGLVGQRVEKYGGNLGEYEDVWQRGYGPQAASAQASNKQMYDYWMGLPESLVKAAQEGTKTGTGTGSQVPSSPTYNPAQILAAMYGPDVFARGSTSFGMGPTTSPQIGEGAMGARAARTPISAPRARSVSAPRSRQVRF
jgi:hypothetical protein